MFEKPTFTVPKPRDYYSWTDFSGLPFELRDGAISFWEPGYDYSDPDFWSSYIDPYGEQDMEAFIEQIRATQMLDWLMKNDPDGRPSWFMPDD